MNLSPQEAANYLVEIDSWRRALLEFLDAPPGRQYWKNDGLTERGQKAFLTFLASAWTPEMTNYANHSPYNINEFPAKALQTNLNPTMESVFEVLRWRASVVDYLSDIWDVLGEPLLDEEECAAMEIYLKPVTDEKLCNFCLDRLDSREHQCMLLSHVRAKWPPTPPKFAKWGKEAKEARAAVQKKSKAWFQFWK